MAAAISCMRGVPASADITDWIAQIPYTIESAPQPMMAQRAVMKTNLVLLETRPRPLPAIGHAGSSGDSNGARTRQKVARI